MFPTCKKKVCISGFENNKMYFTCTPSPLQLWVTSRTAVMWVTGQQDVLQFASQSPPDPGLQHGLSTKHLSHVIFTPELCLDGRHSPIFIGLLAPLPVLILFHFHFITFHSYEKLIFNYFISTYLFIYKINGFHYDLLISMDL